jgi:hypothetical protein
MRAVCGDGLSNTASFTSGRMSPAPRGAHSKCGKDATKKVSKGAS